MPDNASPSVPSTSPSSSGSPSPPAAPSSAAPSSGSGSSSAAGSLQRAAASLGADSSPAQPGMPAGGGSAPTSTSPAIGGAAAPVDPSQSRGPIPYDRHESILRNARETAASEARQQLEQELGWARSLGERRRLEYAVDLISRLERDPNAFYQQLGRELGPPSADADAELVDPEPDLRDLAGQTATYSAKALHTLISNAVTKARRELMAEFAPTREFIQQATAERQQAQLEQHAERTVTGVLTELRQDPEFKKHEAAVLKLYQQMEPIRQQYGSIATLQMAWNKVFRETVLPTLTHSQEQKVLAELQRSAAAGAHGAPTPPPPSSPKPTIREGNIDDIAAHLAKLAGAAATP